MFDELSTQGAEYQAPKPFPTQLFDEYRKLEEAIAEVMIVEQRFTESNEQLLVRYVGQLTLDSASAFEHLDRRLETLGYQAHLTTDERSGKHLIAVLRGRFTPPPRPWWPNALLLILTILTTMWAGAAIDSSVETFSDIFKGLPYALSMMLILGAHELGHYFAARHHRVSVTLPYFIPLPFGFFGTLGAFIQLRAPMRNRNQLFDVGAAGPLVGLIFTIPILLIGVATAKVNDLPTEVDCREEGICGYLLEGNSIIYGATKYLIHGKWLPTDTEDMTLNQLAFAGWTGLFVTGLNLMPVGQLDGGHILYTLIGRRAKRIFVPALIIMGLLALNNSGWILWVILLFFFGRTHATPMDDLTPLDTKRRVLGVIALIIFFLIFTPSPFTLVNLR